MTQRAEWRTMISAPRNEGTCIDIWRVRWHHPDPKSPTVTRQQERLANCWWHQNQNGWVTKIPDSNTCLLVESGWLATHWMPANNGPSEESIP